MTLDRFLDELPRDLSPKIESAGQRLSWIAKGFTEAELELIPSLVRQLNERGIASLTAKELDLLRRAAKIHIGASSPGSPFASYTKPNFDLTSWSNRKYRVRVEIPRSGVLDVSVSNKFNQGIEALTNVEEAEFLVTANQKAKIVSVQRMTGSSQPSFLMRHSGAIRWGGRAVFVAGTGVSAYRIATASAEERPVVIAEEAGGMAGGALGTSLMVAGCVFVGIATSGVGLFLCGLGGGLVGGMTGSGLAGVIARRWDDPNPPRMAAPAPAPGVFVRSAPPPPKP